MMVDREVCTSMDSSFGKSIVGKEGKATFRVNVYSCENKAMPFLECMWSNVIKVKPNSLLVPLTYSALLETQCWYLLLLWSH